MSDQRREPISEDLRTYRCSLRSCRVEVKSDAIPKGWIGIQEYPGDFEIRPARLGLFCGIRHASVAVADMADDEAEVPA